MVVVFFLKLGFLTAMSVVCCCLLSHMCWLLPYNWYASINDTRLILNTSTGRRVKGGRHACRVPTMMPTVI